MTPVQKTQSLCVETSQHVQGNIYSRLCPNGCDRTVIVLEERGTGAIRESKAGCPHFLHHERRDGVVYFVFTWPD